MCVCIWKSKGLINDPSEKRKCAMRVTDRRLHFIGCEFNAYIRSFYESPWLYCPSISAQ